MQSKKGYPFYLSIIILVAAVLAVAALFDIKFSKKTRRIKKSREYSWDFGKTKAGQALRHTFELRNDGKITFEITNITTSCDCIVFKPASKVVLAGKSVPLEVIFNTKGYRGKTTQFGFIFTTSVENPVIRCIIEASPK
jgi:hypothetical protein